MQASLKAGKVVSLDSAQTIADGTAVKTPGTNIFPYIQKNIDSIIAVEGEQLYRAVWVPLCHIAVAVARL